jgi:hypothetical protein
MRSSEFPLLSALVAMYAYPTNAHIVRQQFPLTDITVYPARKAPVVSFVTLLAMT